MRESIESMKLLLRDEAAQILGLKSATLAIWAATAQAKLYGLPVVRMGYAVRYKLEDVEACKLKRCRHHWPAPITVAGPRRNPGMPWHADHRSSLLS